MSSEEMPSPEESGHRSVSFSSDAGSVGSEPSSSALVLRALIRDALLKSDGEDGGGGGGGGEASSASSPPAISVRIMQRQDTAGSDDSVSSQAASLSEFVDADTQMKLLTADLIGEDMEITPEERKTIYAAIHGRCPAELQTAEDRIDELEREIWKLPADEKGPVLRVLQKNPMLFTVSSQAKFFLYGEDFDAAKAARRMAHYWAKREQMYGAQGEEAYREGDVRGPSLDDYVRFFIRSEEVLADPEADDVSRDIAGQFVRCVRRSKVAAIDRQVIEAVTGRDDLVDLLEECGFVRDLRTDSPIVSGSDDFKMAFLRSENFNEVMAAGRLLQHWSMKFELFGATLASKDITVGDIEECSDILKLGFIRLMPRVDKHGRVVVVFNMKVLTDALDESKRNDMHDGILKTIWYVIGAAAEQSRCQRNGLVFLANLRGGDAGLLRQFNIRASARRILLRCMPVRVKAFHFFFPPSESWWQSVIYSLFRFAEPLYKKRAVIHAGADQEHELEELGQCGMARNGLPTELGGDVDFDSYAEWLEKRRAGKPTPCLKYDGSTLAGGGGAKAAPKVVAVSTVPVKASKDPAPGGQSVSSTSGSRRRRRPR